MTAAEVLSLIAYAFVQIRQVVNDPTVSAAAELAHVISEIFGAVDAAVAGKVTPDMATARITALTAAIRSNDEEADLELAKKFPQA